MNCQAIISDFKAPILDLAFSNNDDLQDSLPDVNRPRIQIFDINYVPNPTTSEAGSLLEDSPAINYN